MNNTNITVRLLYSEGAPIRWALPTREGLNRMIRTAKKHGFSGTILKESMTPEQFNNMTTIVERVDVR